MSQRHGNKTESQVAESTSGRKVSGSLRVCSHCPSLCCTQTLLLGHVPNADPDDCQKLHRRLALSLWLLKPFFSFSSLRSNPRLIVKFGVTQCILPLMYNTDVRTESRRSCHPQPPSQTCRRVSLHQSSQDCAQILTEDLLLQPHFAACTTLQSARFTPSRTRIP